LGSILKKLKNIRTIPKYHFLF